MARSVLAEGVRRIAGEARASLDFHHAQTDGTPVERVVRRPAPPSAIPGFVEALAAELGLPVVAGIVPGGSTAPHGARYAVAAGLAVEEVAA